MIETDTKLIISQVIRADLRPGQPVILPRWIEYDSLIIEASINDKRVTDSYQVGVFSQIFGMGLKEVIGNQFSINFNTKQLVSLGNIEPYRLKLQPIKWLKKSFHLRVFAVPSYEIQPNYDEVATKIISEKIANGSVSLLLPNNPSRDGLSILNNSAYPVYMGYDQTVSFSNYSVIIPPAVKVDLPAPIHTGEFWAVTDGNTVSLTVTELV